jgi:hypothetical protein
MDKVKTTIVLDRETRQVLEDIALKLGSIERVLNDLANGSEGFMGGPGILETMQRIANAIAPNKSAESKRNAKRFMAAYGKKGKSDQ